MSFVKKSFNCDADLAQMADNFIAKNPGVSLTLILNQALKEFLQNPAPKIELSRPKNIDAEMDKFIAENSDLMDSLAK